MNHCWSYQKSPHVLEGLAEVQVLDGLVGPVALHDGGEDPILGVGKAPEEKRLGLKFQEPPKGDLP